MKTRNIMRSSRLWGALAALVLAFAATGASAQMKTSYFMEGSLPRYGFNPALTPQNSYFSFAFGNIGIDVNNNFLAVDKFLYPQSDGRLATFMHPSVDAGKFLAGIPSRPGFGVDVRYNLLGFGAYSKKYDYFWSFGIDIRAAAEFNVPKDMFRIMKEMGNGLYDMGDLSAQGMAWAEMSLGFAMPMPWDNLTIGGRLKLLMGVGHAEARLTDATIDVNNEFVRASAGGTIRSAGLGDDSSDLGPDGTVMKLDELLDGMFDDFGVMNGPKSWGAAIDAGAELKLLDDRLKLSAAVVDLGFIRWGGANAVQADINDFAFEYRGYNTEKDDWDVTEPGDIMATKTSGDPYSKRLTTTMNIGAEWNFFDDLLGVGVLSHTKFGTLATHSELTVTGTVRPARWFTAAVSHTLTHNRAGVFGLALNIHPRGFNFFLGMDYIPTQFARFDNVPLPRSMRSFNFYSGISFGLGGRSKSW